MENKVPYRSVETLRHPKPEFFSKLLSRGPEKIAQALGTGEPRNASGGPHITVASEKRSHYTGASPRS
jgi:hypothetical protein